MNEVLERLNLYEKRLKTVLRVVAVLAVAYGSFQWGYRRGAEAMMAAVLQQLQQNSKADVSL